MSVNIKDELHRKLTVARANLLDNLDGLDEYDLRRPMTPTGTNLLGLVKHLAGLEYGYLDDCVGRPAPESLPWTEDDSIGDGSDMWAKPTQRSTNSTWTAPVTFPGGRNRRPRWLCCW